MFWNAAGGWGCSPKPHGGGIASGADLEDMVRTLSILVRTSGKCAPGINTVHHTKKEGVGVLGADF